MATKNSSTTTNMPSANSFWRTQVRHVAVVDAAERGVQRAPERGARTRRAARARGCRRSSRTPDAARTAARSVDSAALGKSRCRSASTEPASSSRAQHPAGDEQRHQRDREQRQQQVVGDHRRQAREVVLVGLAPEAARRRRGAAASHREYPRRAVATPRSDRETAGSGSARRGGRRGVGGARAAATTSVTRRPNSSSITTTSPRAIGLPLTSRSTGSPARRLRVTIEPGPRASVSRIVMLGAADLDGQLDGDVVAAARARACRTRRRGRRGGGLERDVVDGIGSWARIAHWTVTSGKRTSSTWTSVCFVDRPRGSAS